jgi:hypothetical protein
MLLYLIAEIDIVHFLIKKLKALPLKVFSFYFVMAISR